MRHYLQLITVAVLHVSAKWRTAHHLTKGKSRMFELISSDLCSDDFVQSFKVFPYLESNHLPVGIVLKIHTASSVNSELKENPKPTWISKLIWDKTKETDFLANFNSDIIREMCASAVALIDHNIDQALDLFTSSLLRASECMKNHMLTGNRPRYSLWFDDECRKAKTDAKLLLRTFKRSGSQSDRVAYVAARKIYKTFIRKKKTG